MGEVFKFESAQRPIMNGGFEGELVWQGVDAGVRDGVTGGEGC